jgi:hypothetical protein
LKINCTKKWKVEIRTTVFDPFFTEHSEHQVEETSVLGLHSRFNLAEEGGIQFLKPGLCRVNVFKAK